MDAIWAGREACFGLLESQHQPLKYAAGESWFITPGSESPLSLSFIIGVRCPARENTIPFKPSAVSPYTRIELGMTQTLPNRRANVEGDRHFGSGTCSLVGAP